MADNNQKIDVFDPKYTDVYFSEQKKVQEQNVHCQNAVLIALYELFPHLKLYPSSASYDQFRCLFEHCKLVRYTFLDRNSDHCSDTNLHDQYFAFFNILNTLHDHGLVNRTVYATRYVPGDPQQEGYYTIFDLNSGPPPIPEYIDHSRFYNFEASYVAGFLVAEFNKKHHEWIDSQEHLFFDHIDIALTEKGYDVAIKLIEHQDTRQRHLDQQAIMERSSQAAKSSARTARIALWVAGFIAFGSVGSLATKLWLGFFG